MRVRLELPCACGGAVLVTEGKAGTCARCGAASSPDVLRGIPPRSAFGIWHVGMMAAGTWMAVGASCLSYSMQAPAFMRVYSDLGRSLPQLTKLVMHRAVVYAIYGAIALTTLVVFLQARQQIRRGRFVGAWPGRALFWTLFFTATLDGVIQSALHRPLLDLLGDLH